MTTAEALGVIEQLDPHPAVLQIRVRAWPLAMIRAAANAQREADEGDSVMHDRLIEAFSVLTGIPYGEMLERATAVTAADTKHTIGS